MVDAGKVKVYVLGMTGSHHKHRYLTVIDRLATAGHTNIQLLLNPHLRAETDKFQIYQTKWQLPEPNEHFGLGQMGCTVAHLEAFENFLTTKDEVCMIVEDDLLLCDNWLPLLTNIIATAPSHDLLFLGWGKSFADSVPTTKPFLPHAPFCTHCYMITRAGAAKLLAAMKDKGIICTIDIWYVTYFKEYDINSWCVCGGYFLDNIPPQARVDRADGIAFQDMSFDSTV